MVTARLSDQEILPPIKIEVVSKDNRAQDSCIRVVNAMGQRLFLADETVMARSVGGAGSSMDQQQEDWPASVERDVKPR